MIWFNLKELERQIANDELSDQDSFYYVLAHAVVLAVSFGSDVGVTLGWQTMAMRILMVAITIWGLNSAFKANNAVDGRDFLKRYFAISWVVGIRMLVAMVLLAFVLGTIIGIIYVVNGGGDNMAPENRGWTSLASTAVCGIVAYLLIIKSIRSLKPQAEVK